MTPLRPPKMDFEGRAGNSRIRVEFYGDSRYPFDRRAVRRAISDLLVQYGLGDQSVLVEVSVVGDRKMRALNQMHRQIDASTDVLSFPTEDLSRAPDGMVHLGDVVVSYPEVRTEALRMNRLIDVVITEKVLHGVKHLLGEHHDEEKYHEYHK